MSGSITVRANLLQIDCVIASNDHLVLAEKPWVSEDAAPHHLVSSEQLLDVAQIRLSIYFHAVFAYVLSYQRVDQSIGRQLHFNHNLANLSIENARGALLNR